MIKFINKHKKVILVLSIPIIFFLLIEVFLRIYYPDKLRERYYPLTFKPDSLYGYLYIPKAESKKCTPAYCNNIRINNQGFPGENFETHKPHDIKRIIIVSASDATGYENESGISYPHIINQSYKNAGKKIEVLNCSIEGTERAVFQKNLILNKCLEYDPDYIFWDINLPLSDRPVYRKVYKNYVIEYLGYNSSVKNFEQHIDLKYDQKSFFTIFYKVSYTFRYLCKYYIENYNPLTHKFSNLTNQGKWNIEGFVKKKLVDHSKPLGIYTYSIDSTIRVIKSVEEKLAEKNIALYVYNTYSHPYTGYYRKVLNDFGINYIPFNVIPKMEYYHGKLDGHSNINGNKAIASKMNSVLDSIVNTSSAKQILKRSICKHNRLQRKNQRTAKLVLFNITNNHIIDFGTKIFKSDIENSFENLTCQIITDNRISNFAALTERMEYILDTGPSIFFIKTPDRFRNECDSWIRNICDFEKKIRSKGGQIVFCTFSDTRDNKLIKYLFDQHGIEHLYLDISYLSTLAVNNDKINYSKYIYDKIHSDLHIRGYRQKGEYNIAFNKPVFTSSSTESWNYSKTYVNDGVKFQSSNSLGWRGWLDDKTNHTEWIIIDLEKHCQLNSISLYPNYLYGQPHAFPVDLQIQTSIDSDTWSSIKSFKNVKLKKNEMALNYNFEGLYARFIKLHFTNLPKVVYEIEGPCYRIELAEVEVFGREIN